MSGASEQANGQASGPVLHASIPESFGPPCTECAAKKYRSREAAQCSGFIDNRIAVPWSVPQVNNDNYNNTVTQSVRVWRRDENSRSLRFRLLYGKFFYLLLGLIFFSGFFPVFLSSFSQEKEMKNESSKI